MRKLLATILILALAACCPAMAEAENLLPQIDCSTARIPITDAIYAHFTDRGYTGPTPICSTTHYAWLNLAEGGADIIFLIAPTQSELDALAEAGVDVEMKIYGYDGLVFLGNASNPVDSLTPAQIRKIYRRDIWNWDEIEGGTDAEIAVYFRDKESGSQRMFENLVWTGYEMPDFERYYGFIQGDVKPTTAHQVTYFADMGGITRSVMEERYSIGYNIMSYVDSEFLNAEVEDDTVRITGNVNLRDMPTKNGNVLAWAKPGTYLDYRGETEKDNRGVEWYKVDGGEAGDVWVSSRYAKRGGNGDTLKLFAIDGVAPSTESFADGSYPYVTTSYVVIRADEPEGSPARQLFDWIGSDESRSIIAENSTLSVSFSEPVALRTGASDVERPELVELMREIAERPFEREELYAFTEEELTYLWQSAYAAAGMEFVTERYRNYFSGIFDSDPAIRTYPAAQARFTEAQAANEALIRGYLAEVWRAAMARAPRTLAWSEGEEEMTGDDVKAAEAALIARGYLPEEACEGNYTPVLAGAVRAFQRDNGLPETGAIDRLTGMMLL